MSDKPTPLPLEQDAYDWDFMFAVQREAQTNPHPWRAVRDGMLGKCIPNYYRRVYRTANGSKRVVYSPRQSHVG